MGLCRKLVGDAGHFMELGRTVDGKRSDSVILAMGLSVFSGSV